MKYKSMGGLTVNDGRLVNDRPDNVTGIAQAATLRNAVRQARKVNRIAEGIELAESRKGFYKS
jgi:hypothetical protein